MASEVLNVSRERMLDDVAEALKPFVVPDNWFECQEMAERWKPCTYHEAYDRLHDLIEDGKVKKHKLRHKQVYYEMVTDESHNVINSRV